MLKLIHYVVISLGCLVIDLTIYWGALQASVSPARAAVLGYTVGLIVAYWQMKKRIFQCGWLQDQRKSEFLMFGLSGLLGIGITFSTVQVGTSWLNQSATHSKAVAVVLSFASVYLFRKYFVFRPKTSVPSPKT